MKVPIHYGRKVVGIYDTDALIYTTNQYPEDFFIKFQGFAMTDKVIREILRITYPADHHKIKVRMIYHGKTGKKIYEAPLVKWLESECIWDDEQRNERRYILPIKYMEEVNNEIL